VVFRILKIVFEIINMGMMDKMNMVKNIPGGFKAINEARKIQKQMSKRKIEVIEDGVKVVMTGDYKVQELEIDGTSNLRLQKALNKAFKKLQKEMAKQMVEDGDLGSLLKGFGK
jgi:DNA-binding protein YbaB